MKYWKYVRFLFNDGSDYSGENTSDKWLFWRKYKWQWAWTEKKTCGDESHEKQNKHIYASASDLEHIRKGNLIWCKCGHSKSKAGEIDCLCCREVDAMLIASAWGKHLIISFLWAVAWLLVTHVSLNYLVDEFFFLFLL